MKKIRLWHILGALFIFLFGSLLHFIYDWLPNPVTGLISPVNESVWEHLKIFIWPLALYSIIESRSVGKNHQNYLTSKMIAFYLGIFLIISMYYTIEGAFGTVPMVLSIIMFALSVIISQSVSYSNIKNRTYNIPRILSGILITVLIVASIAFTFKPPHIPLFEDPQSGEYGIE